MYEDAYTDPGSPASRRTEWGTYVSSGGLAMCRSGFFIWVVMPHSHATLIGSARAAISLGASDTCPGSCRMPTWPDREGAVPWRGSCCP